jgi:hypothetical protein
MKKLLLLAVLLVAGYGVMAQGTVNFSNGAAGVNAPVTDVDGTTKLAGAGFTAALYAGPSGTVWSSLTLVTPTSAFATGASAGFFFGGTHTVPGVAGGSPAAYQVRVWSANFATWDLAYAAFVAGNPAAKVGVSSSTAWNGTGLPSTVGTTPNLASGIATPPNLLGLQAFKLYRAVPEPSTIALGLLGAAALLLRRRK